MSSVSCFTGATSSSAGTSGYVPAPSAGMQDDYYLCGNGEWVEYVVNRNWISIASASISSGSQTITYTYSYYSDGIAYYTPSPSSFSVSGGPSTVTLTLANTTANQTYVGHRYQITGDLYPGYYDDTPSGTIDALPFSVSVIIGGTQSVSVGMYQNHTSSYVGDSWTDTWSTTFTAYLQSYT